jgi:Ion channel
VFEDVARKNLPIFSCEGKAMRIVSIIFGILLILLVAQDGFETVILPRRVARKIRLARLFYTFTWAFWSKLGRKIRQGNRREQYLSYFGPLSLLLLFIMWAILFILGFAFVQWGLGAPLNAPDKHIDFGTYLYMSGTTFFTLGLGDVTPLEGLSRTLVVTESGLGFGFLALVIGYVPIIYQAFSRREVSIALLDARAGSPPTAVELLKRHVHTRRREDMKGKEELMSFLRDWEHWCSELLESHLSYPVLTYYRSQHERQSWLGALTTVLDACALLLVGVDEISVKPAKFTFAIARHVAVDLAQTYGSPPTLKADRLSSADFLRVQELLAVEGLTFSDGLAAEKRLAELRAMYEPFLASLSSHLLMTLPPWLPISDQVDDWQTSAWDHFLDSSPHTLDRAIHSD